MKNSTGRKLLEERYGKGCFMERAGIRKITKEQEQQMKKKIKGFKKLDRRITYHHIKEKSQGGEVSIENGANLAAYNHEWLHRQSPEVKKEINKRLQEFKESIDLTKIEVDEDGNIISEPITRLKFDMSDSISIPVYDDPVINKDKRNKTFNRAKVKQETQNLIDEELNR